MTMYHIPAGSMMKRTKWLPTDVGGGPMIGSQETVWEKFTSTYAVTYTKDDLLAERYEGTPGNSQLKSWHFYFRLPKSAEPYLVIRVHSQYVFQTNVT